MAHSDSTRQLFGVQSKTKGLRIRLFSLEKLQEITFFFFLTICYSKQKIYFYLIISADQIKVATCWKEMSSNKLSSVGDERTEDGGVELRGMEVGLKKSDGIVVFGELTRCSVVLLLYGGSMW